MRGLYPEEVALLFLTPPFCNTPYIAPSSEYRHNYYRYRFTGIYVLYKVLYKTTYKMVSALQSALQSALWKLYCKS